MPRHAVGRLLEHTGGNPLYIRAVLEELGTEGLDRPGGALGVPRSLAGMVLLRVGAPSPAARQLAAAAAVLGHHCRLAVAAAVAGLGWPARSSPGAASSTSRSAAATSWCTREGDSPIAVARVRIEIPSARAETSAHVRSRSAWSSRPPGPGNPGQDPPPAPGRLDPLADRHPPILPAVFRKLDAVAVLAGPLLPAPRLGLRAGRSGGVPGVRPGGRRRLAAVYQPVSDAL